MNVTIENLAPCRKLLRIEVGTDEVNAAFGEVSKEFFKSARLPGFRPGKAPRALVEKTYGKDIEKEVERKLMSSKYQEAIKTQQITVLNIIDVEDAHLEPGKPFQFTATVETAPEFELPEYKGLPVKREVRAVTDEDVQRALDVLRTRAATFETVNRPLQDGDIAVVNYQGATSDGKPFTDVAPTARGLTQQKEFWIEVKPGSFIPGFTEQLIGATAGEKRRVTVDFPADFVTAALANQQGHFDVELVAVKERSLPEVTDELAKTYGAESAEDLKNHVRADLENELTFKQRREQRNQIADRLLEKANFDLPESIVEGETRSTVYDIVRQNQERGASREDIEKQKDEIFSLANATAKNRVKLTFLLKRIAEKEGISVTNEELAQRIYAMAERHQMTPEKLIKELKERNGVPEVHDSVLTGKVLDFLEQNAQVEEVPAAPATS